MIATLYFPSRSGDLRLEGSGDSCRLTLEGPTPEEISVAERLIWAASRKGWVDPDSAFLRTKIIKDGDTPQISIPFTASLDTISRLLLGTRAPTAGVILAVRYADGSIQATLDGPAEGLALLEEPAPAAPRTVEAARAEVPREELAVPTSIEPALEPAKVPVKAAVMTRPTLCCPTPSPGPQDRASEVLAAFLSPWQWEEWCAEGMIHCTGNLTGDTYRIVHRKHPLAQKQGKIAWCVTQNNVVHCHQTHFPPPEEVLSVVLTLQYGEDYIRNASGYFGPGTRFPHPLKRGAWDGVGSAGLVSALPRVLPWLTLFAALP